MGKAICPVSGAQHNWQRVTSVVSDGVKSIFYICDCEEAYQVDIPAK